MIPALRGEVWLDHLAVLIAGAILLPAMVALSPLVTVHMLNVMVRLVQIRIVHHLLLG